jgi:hypothetical protein
MTLDFSGGRSVSNISLLCILERRLMVSKLDGEAHGIAPCRTTPITFTIKHKRHWRAAIRALGSVSAAVALLVCPSWGTAAKLLEHLERVPVDPMLCYRTGGDTDDTDPTDGHLLARRRHTTCSPLCVPRGSTHPDLIAICGDVLSWNLKIGEGGAIHRYVFLKSFATLHRHRADGIVAGVVAATIPSARARLHSLQNFLEPASDECSVLCGHFVATNCTVRGERSSGLGVHDVTSQPCASTAPKHARNRR